MSTKKNIINKDRFKSLSKISTFEKNDLQDSNNTDNTKNETLKSRFELEISSDISSTVDIEKLKPSPKKWNFYSPLPDDKFFELIESIEKNSLLHPIVVWEQQDYYMILSGHNRVRAYQKLFEMTKDDKYKKIPALIKKKDDISEDIAKEIIVDTNWIQRQLSTYEKTQSILQKYVRIKSEKIKGEKTRDLVASNLGITGRMVQNYISLNKLNSDFFALIDSGKINIKTAVLLSKLPQSIQVELLLKKDKINFDINIIKNAISTKNEENLVEMLTKNEQSASDMITVKIQIRRDQEQDFMKMYKKWLIGK